MARLEARASHARGDLRAALAPRNLTIRDLAADSNGEDDFFEYDLPWLVEAGRLKDAGERAFLWLRGPDLDADEYLATLLNQRLADQTDVSVWWPLCVMMIVLGSSEEQFHGYFGTDMEALRRKSPVHARLFAPLAGATNLTPALFGKVLEAAGQVAEEREPGHPWTLRLADELSPPRRISHHGPGKAAF
ncbi:MAG: hypothetical protein FWD68_09960 [Alphaproteobacteria bacterium]|nr:hypothetical protein [Alphaproteobacteria bacterium]